MRPAILFDMNGVLVNDEDVHEAAFREALRAQGFMINRDDYARFFAGRTDHEGFTAFLEANSTQPIDVDLLQRAKAHSYIAAIGDELHVFEDAIALLHHLKASGFTVGLVTGSSRHEVDILLGKLNLHGVFDAVVVAEDVCHGKPSAEPFLLAARDLDVEPRACVVIEDSPAGIRSAQNAGMRSIAVSSTHTAEDLAGATVIVDHAGDISDGMLISR